MGEGLYRAQILLKPEQHRALAEIARQQNKSFSEVVREVVEMYLNEREETFQKQMKAFERIEQHRAMILARNGGKPLDIDVTSMIEEMREERDNELLANILRRD